MHFSFRHAPCFLIVLVFALAAHPESQAQECGPIWEVQTSDDVPSARGYHSICYDSAQHESLLTFGWIPDRQDLWSKNGAGWFLRCDPCAPIGRRESVLEFDKLRGVAVAFGGSSAQDEDTEALDDLWEWNGVLEAWTEIPKSDPWPSARAGAASCYDELHDRVVIFGGVDPYTETLVQDMWAWDGSAWVEIGQDQGDPWPAARQSARMVHDTTRNVLVLFGGKLTYDPADFSAETWEFDLHVNKWRLVCDQCGPTARAEFAFAFVPTRGTTILQGGWDGQSEDFGDCWEWNGVHWSEIVSSTPGHRKALTATYDSTRDRVVLYGGVRAGNQMLDDTWEMYNDCNCNSIPDGDEVNTGLAQDCNGNRVPDECDIASGRSGDLNGDGIPDECIDCCETERENLTVFCRTRNDGSLFIKGTVGRGCPGEPVTFSLDRQCSRERTINDRGKCRAKWKGCAGDIPPGPHTVTATLSCRTVLGEPGNVECP